MAITVNDVATMTDVTVNGTAMDVVNVNGVEVFRKQPIWYDGIQIAVYDGYNFSPNPNTIKEAYGVGYLTQMPANWQYTLTWPINVTPNQRYCIIFKDFTQVKLSLGHNYPDTLKFRYGKCSKSATCAGLSSGTGITYYTDQNCDRGTTLEINGDIDNDCFLMYYDTRASAMSTAEATISINPGSIYGGYRYY